MDQEPNFLRYKIRVQKHVFYNYSVFKNRKTMKICSVAKKKVKNYRFEKNNSLGLENS